MRDPKDIRFRLKRNLIVARIKVGGKWLDRSGGWHTKAEALPDAIKLRDELQAQYALEHPAAPVVKATVEIAIPKPGKSIKELAAAVLEKHCKRQRLRRGPKNHRMALNWLWQGLGKSADLPPRELTGAPFAHTRDLLYKSELSQSTMSLYARLIREVLLMLEPHGLDPAVIDELKRIPKKGISEASGEAFNPKHFKIMFQQIQSQSETTQVLFWIGASGGPQIVDTVFLPFAAIDFDSGLLSYHRIKTGEKMQFCALPPLLELLKARRDRLGSAAVYVLPELIFSEIERQDPKCNQADWSVIKAWKGKVPEPTTVYGSVNGWQKMRQFFEVCGIKAKGITHKSFRKSNISFWASIGVKLKVRMRMAGHRRDTEHLRYDTAPVPEILRAGQITWQYYQSIMDGKPFFCPSTPYDLYEALLTHWENFPEILRAGLREDLHGSLEPLYQRIVETMKHEIVGLKGFISELFGHQHSLIQTEIQKVLDRLPHSS